MFLLFFVGEVNAFFLDGEKLSPHTVFPVCGRSSFWNVEGAHKVAYGVEGICFANRGDRATKIQIAKLAAAKEGLAANAPGFFWNTDVFQIVAVEESSFPNAGDA